MPRPSTYTCATLRRKVEAYVIPTVSHPARHARHADPPRPVVGAIARLRHRAAARADLQIGRPGQSGIAVSSATSARAEGLAESRVAEVGDRPRGEVLRVDPRGRQAAPNRKGELAAL